MDDDILERLRIEESELARKLDAIRAVINVYAPARGAHAPQPQAQRTKEAADATPKRLSSSSEYADSIRAVARATIETSPELPVPTRTIVARVKQHGIQIRGQNELNAVSALLSRSEAFQSQGRSGWILAEFANRYGVEASGEDSETDENGAPNGQANGAPETGEGYQPSPVENLSPEARRLLG